MVEKPQCGIADDVVGLPEYPRVDGERSNPKILAGDHSLSRSGTIALAQGGSHPGCVGARDEWSEARYQPTGTATGRQAIR